MPYNLFLDDDRMPAEVANYANPVDIRPLYRKEEWAIVRNYPDFVKTVETRGVPAIISFDHDLYPHTWEKNLVDGKLNYAADDFKDPEKRNGLHCMIWFFLFSLWNKGEPYILVHTGNLNAAETMAGLIKGFSDKVNWDDKALFINSIAHESGMKKEAAFHMSQYMMYGED